MQTESAAELNPITGFWVNTEREIQINRGQRAGF